MTEGSHSEAAAASFPPKRERLLAFAKMLSSAVVSQALLSAANFAVGLLLIRHASDEQYGYYILASSAVLLILSLQGAFLNPPMVNRLAPLEGSARGDLIGGLYRDQSRWLRIIGAAAFLISAALWYGRVLDSHTGPVVLATIGATLAAIHRNFFRLVLLAHKRPQDVLRTDIYYIVILVVGVVIALNLPHPDVGAMLVMTLASIVSGWFTSRALWRHETWNTYGYPGILREVAPLAAWSTAGAAIHWAFSQGSMYFAAGTLDVAAVAALAATRLLMMPVNLLSLGIGTLMLPLTVGWLRNHGRSVAFKRLSLFSLGLACIATCYFVVLWFARDWIFAEVLKKTFAQRDALLLLWSGAFAVMVIRDQLLYLLVALERFHQLTSLAAITAVISLAAGYVGMRHLGVIGAPIGVLLGEVVNLAGIFVLTWYYVRPARARSPVELARVTR
jgi:O-antigen/teichoic acid export membrane protein